MTTRREFAGNKEALRRIGLALAFVAVGRMGETVSKGALKVRGEVQPDRAVTLVAWFKGQRVASFRVPVAGRSQLTGIRVRSISRWWPLLDRVAGRSIVALPPEPTHTGNLTVH
jgi:hypothetical protein